MLLMWKPNWSPTVVLEIAVHITIDMYANDPLKHVASRGRLVRSISSNGTNRTTYLFERLGQAHRVLILFVHTESI